MRLLLPILFILISQLTVAQQLNIELNHQYTRWIDKSNNQTSTHSSFKPLLNSYVNYDSLKNDYYSSLKKRTKWFGRKLFNESLIFVDTTNFQFSINPSLIMEYGKENGDSSLYKNTRGITVNANIGEKVSFSTAFYESQAFFPSYVSSYSKSLGETTYPGSGIIPGQGRAKPFKNGGYDYGMASAYVNYVPNDYINVRTGHGKHFIGNGYRSLLLSDNAFNYPYFRINAKLEKKQRIEYSNLYASLFENERVPLTNMPEAPFIKKGLSVHYLSYIPKNWFQIGIFESTAWDTWDNLTNQSKPFNAQVYNPIIGFNYLTSGFNSSHYSMLGTNLKISPTNNLILYNQYSISKTSGNGVQLGLKVFNLFGIIPNLYIQTEYNYKGYSPNYSIQSHYGESLTHFAYNDFSEFVGIIGYNFKRIYFNIKMNYLDKKDVIILDTLGIVTNHNVLNINGEISYLINPSYNLNLYLAYNYRETNQLVNTSKIQDSNYIYFGLRTSLRNLYYDF